MKLEEKRYTIKELLASPEAMKDLLHERILAVRDDLNFAINTKSGLTASAMTRLSQVLTSIDDLRREVRDSNRRLDRIELVMNQLKNELQRTWWETLTRRWAIMTSRVRDCLSRWILFD